MTAIALIPCPNGYVVIGDLAISGDAPEKIPLFPTIGPGDSVFPEGSKWVVKALCSKVLFPTPGLVVAWAGLRLPVREAIEALCERPLTTREAVEDGARRVGCVIGSDELCLLGAVRIGEDWNGFRIQGGLLEWAAPGEGFCAGSGGEDLRDALKMELEQLQGDISGYETAVQCHMGCARLLLNEISGEPTLLHYYGGGYEMAFATGVEAQRHEAGPYVVFWVPKKGNGYSVNFLKLLQYRYVGDRLVVSVWEAGNKWHTFVADHPLLVPSEEEVRKIAGTPPIFGEVDFINSLFILGSGDMAVRFDRGRSKITVLDDGKEVKVGLSPEFRKEMHPQFAKFLKDSS